MKATADIVRIDPHLPDSQILTQTAAMMRKGAVVVFPTYGLYGLGGHALMNSAVERIFTIKFRDQHKPLLVLIDCMAMLEAVALPVDAWVRAVMARFWPGHVTFVVEARDGLPQGLTAGTGRIGVRWTSHPVAGGLVRALGAPLIGTSANISGSGGCADIAHLDPKVLAAVDRVLDCGPLAGGPGSTVVDVTGPNPVILRDGAVSGTDILACFN